MRTNEFIRGVLDLGCRVEEYEWVIEVWSNHEHKKFASITKSGDKSLYVNANNYSLIKLCIEYAETPLAEREEEKRYTVVLPDLNNKTDYVHTLFRRDSGLIIGYRHKSHLEGFTEAEIKRSHEYLWQFRKEVE